MYGLPLLCSLAPATCGRANEPVNSQSPNLPTSQLPTHEMASTTDPYRDELLSSLNKYAHFVACSGTASYLAARPGSSKKERIPT